MLRPLLLLCALIAVPGAAQQILSTSTKISFTSCPISFFGQTYTEAYVSFTSSNFVVCFNGFYPVQTRGDCVVGPRVSQAFFSIEPRFAFTETNIHSTIPAITTAMQCYLQFYLRTPTYTLLNVAKFQNQAALELFYTGLGTQRASVLLNGLSVAELSVTNTNTVPQTVSYTDLSGCRQSGVAYKPGVVMTTNPATCTTVRCSQTGAAQTVTCGPSQTCNSNGMCNTITTSAPPTSVDSMCTVTGPSVIDFHNNVNSVKDRCAYSLLQIPSVPGFQVLANFLERRLTDVSFLDSVTLQLNNNNIHLKQGGRVLLNDTPQDLSSSPQMVGGVMVSKDQTGVTVMIQINNLKITVSFDGYTAQIQVKGPGGSSLQGLCENSSSKPRVLESSPMSCQTQYTNTDQSFINCINKTESCYLLKEAPFTSCAIDPKPYITACTDTLSRYPDVDGLKCQFLEAYVRACSLKLSTIPDSWMSKADCHSNESHCQNKVCSDHEFCGESSHYGDSRCYCRAIFASSYRERNALGDPTVCRDNTASLTLATCLLEEQSIDYSVLHLNDPSCRGQVNEQNHTVTFSFNSSSCGTEIMTNDSQIIYKNTIMTQNFSSDVIIRHDEFMLDFSCYHARHSIQSASFTIMESEVSGVMKAGPWTYTVSMRAYVDDACSKPVERYTNLKLNQRIWVKLETNGLDENVIAVVTDSCWATDLPSPTATKKYYLIENGCPNPADQSVKVKENGEGTSNYFSFNMFRFSGGSREIYLHCSLHLCVKQEGNCVPPCSKRRRRRSASSSYESDSFISMGWTH